MERRLLTFVIASSAFFFAYISLRVMLVPPPQAERGDAAAEFDDFEADRPAPDDEPSLVEPLDPADPLDDGPAPPPRHTDRPQWLTLGSMDPASGFHMLVTLNTRGAGVERIELTERDDDGDLRYRRVDVRSGYLGYFAGEPAPTGDGVLVNVVGPGTPAATATSDQAPPGLRVGDRILAVAGRAIATPQDLARVLNETVPGQRVTVEVLRGPEGLDAEPGESEPAGGSADDPDLSGNGIDRPGDGADPNPTAAGAEPDSAEPDGAEPDGADPGGPPAGRLRPIVFTATLSEHPLDIVRLAEHGGEDQIEGNLSRLSCLLTLSKVNQKSIAANTRVIPGLVDPTMLVWSASPEAAGDGEQVELSLLLSDSEMEAIGGRSLELRRRYHLAPGTYDLDLEVAIDNRSDEAQDLAYRLEGVNGLTLEGWWYSNKISPNWGGAAARDIVYRTTADGHQLISGFALHKQAKRQPTNPDQAIFAADGEPASRDLKYIGVDAQYFLAAYLPDAAAETDQVASFRRAAAGIVADAERVPRHQERAVNVSFSLDSEVVSVPPGRALQDRIRLYAGPKDPTLLAEHGLQDAIYYGWFSIPAKLLAGLLHLLYLPITNYGIAIILLTVVVRGAMFPLSRKAAINAQKMQELAPEFKKIADRYKDDLEGRMKAQRELQQRVGFNPMAGCLPMFLQLPIFIGLYRALSVDIELRQAAFSSWTSWASNLAGPDMLYYWGDWLWEYLSGRGTGWLGPYFNILPVAVVLLFLLQQKLFMPPATDEQTAMTQKVMGWMTLVMGLFFFRVPAGLCIYFITSSLWGIGERVLVKRTIPQKKFFDAAVLEAAAAGKATSAAKPDGGKSSRSLADRLRDQMKPPEPQYEPPSRRKRPGVGKKKR